jgi:hypothetical protein
MTSHGSSDEGNAQSHTDGLAQEGFPRILWEVLQGVGYMTTPDYAVQLFEKHRVHRCRVRMTLEPHPLQPGWRSLDSESFGYMAEDTIEAIVSEAPVGRRRRHSRTTTSSSRWSSRPLSMRRGRMTMTLSRTPQVLAPQVQGTSTCEVP